MPHALYSFFFVSRKTKKKIMLNVNEIVIDHTRNDGFQKERKKMTADNGKICLFSNIICLMCASVLCIGK